MPEKILSLLMPVYNGEKYLTETLNSVFAAVSSQNIAQIEFLVIDDGSHDESVNILKNYQKNHNFALLLQKNQGATRALKTLLKQATGEYILAIDQDDLLEPQAIDKLISYLSINQDNDLVLFDHFDFGDDITQKILHKNGCEFNCDDGQSVFVALLKERKYNEPLWNKVMRREMAIQNDIFTGDPREIDGIISPKIFCVAKKVGYLPEALYGYRKHRESAYKIHAGVPFVKRCLYAIDSLLNLAETRGISKEFKKGLMLLIGSVYMGAVRNITNESEFEENIKELEKHLWVLKYSKWNRKYIYRPIIHILGLKTFCMLRK